MTTFHWRLARAKWLSRVEEINRTVRAAGARMSKPSTASPPRDRNSVTLCLCEKKT